MGPAVFGTAARASRLALYYGLADKLPYSPTPGVGRLAGRLRSRLTRGLFDNAGAGINVEKGAWFGSGRGITLGTGSGIGLDCVLMGPVTIGADVMMGPRCLLVSHNHITDDPTVAMRRQGMGEPLPIIIEDDVWLGGHVVVLPGVRIGRGAIVAAGSVVTADVPPLTVVGGNPARVLRRRQRTQDGDPRQDEAPRRDEP